MTDIAIQDVTAVAATVRLAGTGDKAAFARLVAQHHAARLEWPTSSGDAEMTRDAAPPGWSRAPTPRRERPDQGARLAPRRGRRGPAERSWLRRRATILDLSSMLTDRVRRPGRRVDVATSPGPRGSSRWTRPARAPDRRRSRPEIAAHPWSATGVRTLLARIAGSLNSRSRTDTTDPARQLRVRVATRSLGSRDRHRWASPPMP